MATKTKKRTGEKSQAVRAYLEMNPDAKVGQVVADLKKQGISISPAIVYQIRSAPKKPSSKTVKSAAPSANGASEHGSKSDAVRAALKELGRKASAKEITSLLAGKGISVSNALIVKVKSRTKSGPATIKQGRPIASPSTNGSAATVKDLSLANVLAAKKLADELGGVATLRKALDVLDLFR